MNHRSNPRNPAFLILSLAALALLTGGIVFLMQTGPAEDRSATSPASESATPEATRNGASSQPRLVSANQEDVEAAYATQQEWEDEPFAASLKGTRIDGSLKADAQGRLIVDLETRDLFDYFLNTVGEVEEGEAIDQIRALAESHLPESATREAMDLLGHYIDYKEKAVAINNQPMDSDAAQTPEGQRQVLKKALAEMKQARRETMPSEAVDAFFGMEEAYGEFTLERIEIEGNQELSRAEKQQQIRLAQEDLPEAIRETERNIQETNDHQQQVKETIDQAGSPEKAAEGLKELGLSEDQVSNVVEQMRFEEEFDDTYSAYQRERDRIMESGLSSEDREQSLESLRKKHFDSEQAQSKARFRDLDG